MAVSGPARWCFGIAATVCIAAMLGHELLGGSKVLDPLHQVDLPADVVWLHHFSWHVGSVALVAMAAMFVLAARKAEHLILAGFGTAISVGFAVLGISLDLWRRRTLGHACTLSLDAFSGSWRRGHLSSRARMNRAGRKSLDLL